MLILNTLTCITKQAEVKTGQLPVHILELGSKLHN